MPRPVPAADVVFDAILEQIEGAIDLAASPDRMARLADLHQRLAAAADLARALKVLQDLDISLD